MPPELPPSGSPADWLRHAHSDLAKTVVAWAEKVVIMGDDYESDIDR